MRALGAETLWRMSRVALLLSDRILAIDRLIMWLSGIDGSGLIGGSLRVVREEGGRMGLRCSWICCMGARREPLGADNGRGRGNGMYCMSEAGECEE
jgi:hypothetical protein